MEIVRKKLSADEVTPPGARWNEDCNCTQTTPDGGATWVDNPGVDPRVGTAYLLPANTGDDPRCIAATGMSERVRTIVDAFTSTSNLTAAATAIFGIVSLLFPPAIIVAAIIVFVDFLIAIGAIEVAALMTNEVYDDLKCIFYEHADPSGQLSEEAFAAVYVDVDATLPEGAAGIVDRCLDLIGFAGINNAGAIATEEGDCSACCETPWCYSWSNVDDMVLDGWTLAINTDSSKYWSYLPRTLELTAVEASWTTTGDASDPASAFSLWRLSVDESFLINDPLDTDPSPSNWTGSETCGAFTVGVNTPSGVTLLTALQLSGSDCKPAWSHGTDC